ncbi:PRD domain-containing protein [Lachnospira multipara]|jgi:transcriptional antiterminator|uniref:PRD domain-containing protein n=1 Tax=Lachnospira multipara TaxID=28051 RepID=UPI000486DAB9|nr:PRD domain-containing protein [Lachnospira multipara]
MYKVKKVLNHNTVIAVNTDKLKEYLVLGKGVGFGKKPTQEITISSDDRIFSLEETTERGNIKEFIKNVSPIYIELADAVLCIADEKFDNVDHNIIFPMADHLEFAVKRIEKGEEISNPLIDDIKILFHSEYKIAETIRPLLKEQFNIEISDDEIGYVALHVHSAISNDRISQSMEIARAVRECVTMIENVTKTTIRVDSLSYNRLMNHIRYMVARVQHNEPLKLNMNDYILNTFPQSFGIAATVCEELGKSLGTKLDDIEIGYLAMHIERVKTDIEQDS